MKAPASILFKLLLLLLPTLALSKVTIWDPLHGETLFHAELIEIQWACSDNDQQCLKGPLDLRLYQQGSLALVSAVVPVSRGPTSIVWAVPPTLAQGDNFYFKVFLGSSELASESPSFSIRHSGINIINPAISTVWVPNVDLRVRFGISPLFSEKNHTLHVVLSDGRTSWFKLGQVLPSAGVFEVPSNALPWGDKPKFYHINILFNDQSISKSPRFVLSPNAASSCDDFSLAALFSAEAYAETSEDRIYDVCGQYWKTVYAYNVGDNGAVIVSNPITKVAVVSFRGTTQSLTDWMNTLAAVPISCDGILHSGCKGGFLHIGFAASFNASRDAIRVISYNLVQQGYRLIITGHSKGGAIAAIQAADLLQAFTADINPSNLKLISFGQPRVGDENFMTTLDALLPSSKCNSVRFVGESRLCGKDPVSGLPPKGFWHHAGQSMVVPCSAGCLKREALGLAIKCHLMQEYLDEIVVQNLGHSQC